MLPVLTHTPAHRALLITGSMAITYAYWADVGISGGSRILLGVLRKFWFSWQEWAQRCLCPLFGTDSEWWPLFVFFLLTYNAWPSHKCRHDPFSWQRHEAPPYCMSDVIPNCIHKKSKNRPQQTIFTIYSDAESLLPHTLSECTIKMLPASV